MTWDVVVAELQKLGMETEKINAPIQTVPGWFETLTLLAAVGQDKQASSVALTSHHPVQPVIPPVHHTGETMSEKQQRVRLLMPTTGSNYLMELFDNPKYPQNLGQYRFPGGGVEPGETHEQAAIREAKEEFGADLSGKSFKYIGADPRPEYANEHYLEVADHGVLPGSREDAANVGSKVTLFDGHPSGEKYIGPDLLKLLQAHAAMKQAGLIAHIGGASGSGKSTVLNRLAAERPDVVTHDVDQIDYDAKNSLGYPIDIDGYTPEMHTSLGKKKKELSDAFVSSHGDKPVVLGGINNDESGYDTGAPLKLMMNTGPLRSTFRGYRRDYGTEWGNSLWKFPKHYLDNRKIYNDFKAKGYEPVSNDQAIARLLEAIGPVQKQADLRPDISLQPHQDRVVHRIHDQLDHTGKSRLLLFHSLGSGKTLSGLAGADSTATPYTAIVPAALRNNLRKEQDRFIDPATATPSDVISYNAAASGKPVPKDQSLLLDEAQRLRNPESAQTKRILDLADNAKQLTLLSGTPVVNDPGDFAVMHHMLTGKNLTPDEFHNRYVRERPYTPPWYMRMLGAQKLEPGVQNEDELRKDLAGHVDYHAPLTAKTKVDHEDVVTEMSRDQANLYRNMYGKLPTLMRWKLERDYPIDKNEIVKLQGFMTGPRQVGLSTLPFMRGQKDPLKAFDRSPKLQEAFHRLHDVLTSNPSAKALIFSNFIEAGLTPYQKALEREGIPAASFTGKLNDVQRKQLVDQYNANKLRVALVGPAGTEGLSFKGTRLVQLLDPHWNNVRGQQSEGRALRFDSHDDLPPDQRQVTVQRFISRLPPQGLARLTRLLHLGGEPTKGSDDYLSAMAARKEKVNERFLELLRSVGSQPV